MYLMPPEDFLPFMVPFKGGAGPLCGGACTDSFQWSVDSDPYASGLLRNMQCAVSGDLHGDDVYVHRGTQGVDEEGYHVGGTVQTRRTTSVVRCSCC